MKDDPTLTKNDAIDKAKIMIKDGTAPKTGVGKVLSSLGDVGKNIASGLSSFTGIGDGKDFDESGAAKLTEDIFSAEKIAELEKKAKAAGVSISEFINNLLK